MDIYSQFEQTNLDIDVLIRQAREFLNKKPITEQAVIAVFGLMNAGKSYLLNMLTDHIETEYFKTNDFRETAEVKAFFHKDFVYLDTPGLDASIADNQEAVSGVSEADIVLFLHQPQGELEAVEIAFLKCLSASFGERASQNIILVISKADKESEEKIAEIEAKIQVQCQQYLGFNPRCFQISGTRFQTGVKKHQERLAKASHVQDLADYLNEIGASCLSGRKIKADLAAKQWQALIDTAIKQLDEEKNSIQTDINQAFNDFNAIAGSARAELKKRYLKEL